MEKSNIQMTGDRILHIRVFKATALLRNPIADATHRISEISFLVLRIYTHEGIQGESYLLCFQYSPHAIVGAIRDIVPLALQFPIWETGGFVAAAAREHEYFGNTGVLNWAMALVNIAMWDARGKSLGIPIHKMLGICKDKVEIYGSGGWLSYTTGELTTEVSDYIKRGFRSVKIKVGSDRWQTDIDRLKAVRKTVGDDIHIMMDANQGLDVRRACDLAKAAEQLDIHWFEEPIHHKDFDGYRSIRERTGISLAMGEREYSSDALRELIKRDAISIWQPDLLRIGSVEAWRDSAAYAGIHHIPVLPHYYKDYDVSLLCTIPNGVGAESFDWIDPLIDNPLLIKNGFAYPNESPGWGFNFLDEHLKEIKL